MKSYEDSFCGLYCGACELFLATHNRTLDKLAAERGVQASDLECYGCKSHKTSIYCENCIVKKCCKEKGLNFCFECDTYPCRNLQEFWNGQYPHKCLTKNNLKIIKDIGVDHWLKLQQNRWSCKSCGSRYSYYSNFCSQCGEKLFTCIEELEKDEEI